VSCATIRFSRIFRRSTHPSQPMCPRTILSTSVSCSGRSSDRCIFLSLPRRLAKQNRLKNDSAQTRSSIFNSELPPTSPLVMLHPMRHHQSTRVPLIYPETRRRVYPLQLRRACPSTSSELSTTNSTYRCAHETLSQFQGPRES
jgi:hypothetical protein